MVLKATSTAGTLSTPYHPGNCHPLTAVLAGYSAFCTAVNMYIGANY
jgi:hypothetical protein